MSWLAPKIAFRRMPLASAAGMAESTAASTTLANET